MSRNFATLITSAFLVGFAVSMVWGDGGNTTQIHACVAKDGTVRIVTPVTNCKAQETAVHWNVQGPSGAPGIAGYEILEGPVLLNEPDAGNDRQGSLQKWNTGRAHCSQGKKILGGAHLLEFHDGNRLTNEDWATLVQWSTQLTTTSDGTGEYQVTVLNPQEIALRAYVTIVCANVAS